MDVLHRLLQLARAKNAEDDREREPPFQVEVDQNLLSDRRSFRLTCSDGGRFPFTMGGLPYTFLTFTLHVHEKGLKVVDLKLSAEGEPAESASVLGEFLGRPRLRATDGAVVDLEIRLKPAALASYFARLPRQDDGLRILQVRDHLGRRVVRNLSNYEVAAWELKAPAAAHRS